MRRDGRFARHDRRHVADAAAEPRLCRSEIAPARRAPAINPRYLSDETDRRAVVGGLRFLRRMFAAPALAKYVVAETVPGSDVQSDDELLDYARRTGSHGVSCHLHLQDGQDTMAVVDDRLRVHGLDRLRVIDASVMPAVTSTNTNAPTIMIAEKGAAMVREDARQGARQGGARVSQPRAA